MIRIVTDSASDLDMEIAKELDVISVPLTVSFGEQEFKDDIEISKNEFYERLIEGSIVPRTSQVPPYDFEQIFMEAKRAGDDVIAILLSSGMSGTYQSAISAAVAVYGENGGKTKKPACFVLDSRSASAGQQLLVETAVHLREQGLSAKDIMKQLRSIRSNVCVFACIDTLEYLQRGGRISKVAAVLGGIIHVKPVIYVNRKGIPDIVARFRGTQKAIQYLLQLLQEEGVDPEYPIYIMYSYRTENAQRLRKAIRMAGYQVRMRHVIHVGAVIGTHIGPNAFGVAFVRKV